jgi:FixJ family two-component response regulator
MSDGRYEVHLIDDDERVLATLSRLLRTADYTVRCYGSAEAYLAAHDPAEPGVAIVDLKLPGMDGFDVQRALSLQSCERPIVFLTGNGEIPDSVRAMKAGAVDFLVKPVDAETLLAAIGQARALDEVRRSQRQARDKFAARLSRLTPRERQVLDGVVAGRLNKQIAGDLGTVEKTIKVHRGRMMRKMEARTLGELLRAVQSFGA